MPTERTKASGEAYRPTLPAARYLNAVSIGAGAQGSLTVPAGVDLVELSYTTDGPIYQRSDGGTAGVPTASATGESSWPLAKGERRQVEPAQVLSFHNANAATAIVVMACHRVFAVQG